MKRIWVILAALLLVPWMALAYEYAPGCLMDPPKEVQDHIARSFSAYELEDYCEVYDTPYGDYGFALLKAGDERLLLGYEEKNGKMSYWLKNYGAVMQGEPEAWFVAPQKGEMSYDENGKLYEVDGLSFGVVCLDESGTLYEKSVGYHWENGGFKLVSYKDWSAFYGEVDVQDGELHFKNFMEGWDFGRARGTVQRDLRYVSFNVLPKTIGEAREKLTSAPKLEYTDRHSSPNIYVKEIRFTGGKKVPVYQGPGEEYGRAANGKASVSTNDWIQVFCRYNGYVMIQYDISAEQYRVGWIEESALPKGAEMEEIDLRMEREDETELSYACALTDDPYNSQTPIAWLEAGTPVLEVIYHLYGWSYVRVHVDGKAICGFVPSDAPIHG